MSDAKTDAAGVARGTLGPTTREYRVEVDPFDQPERFRKLCPAEDTAKLEQPVNR